MAGKGATWMTTKGYFHDTLLVGSNHSVHAVVSDIVWAVLTTSLYISKRNTLTKF
jgi:hypothetical protein